MRLRLAALAVTCLLASSPQSARADACGANAQPIYRPLPSGTSQSVASFHGAWTGGQWVSRDLRGALCVELHVLGVNPDGTVDVLYVHGASADFRLPAPNARPLKGSVSGNQLVVEHGGQRQAKSTYTLQANGTLKGNYNYGGGSADAELRKAAFRVTGQ